MPQKVFLSPNPLPLDLNTSMATNRPLSTTTILNPPTSGATNLVTKESALEKSSMGQPVFVGHQAIKQHEFKAFEVNDLSGTHLPSN